MTSEKTTPLRPTKGSPLAGSCTSHPLTGRPTRSAGGEQERRLAEERAARTAEDEKLERDDRGGNQNAGDGALDVAPDAGRRRIEMAEGGAERDADQQRPQIDPDIVASA